MLPNKMGIVFLNNDIKHSEAKHGLFLKANGYEGRVRMIRVFIAFIRSFIALPQIVSRLSGEIRSAT